MQKSGSYLQELYDKKIDDLSSENIFLHELLSKNLLLKKGEISTFLSSVAQEKFPLLEDEVSQLPKEIQEVYRSYKSKINDVAERKIDTLAEQLRYFATMPLSLVPIIQQYVFRKNKIESNQVELFPKISNNFVIEINECNKEPDFVKESYPNINVYLYAQVIEQQITDCYFQNSKNISELLNALIKSQFDAKKKYRVTYDPSSAHEKTFVVSTYLDFTKMIDSLGFSLELATTRMFVDFFGFYYKDPKTKEFLPIIFPSWFMHNEQNKKLFIPGEHGEIELLISKQTESGRVRVAGTKYYMGIPNDALPGHASFWRPRLYKRPQWYKTHVDTVFHGSANAAVLTSVGRVTKHIHDIQNQFQLPLNSYGFYVCSDSIALVAFDLVSKIDEYARLNHSFPLVRSDQNLLSSALGQNFHFTKEIMKKLDLSYEKFNEIYPPDYQLSGRELKRRLEESFGAENAKRFSPYFDFNYKEIVDFLKK